MLVFQVIFVFLQRRPNNMGKSVCSSFRPSVSPSVRPYICPSVRRYVHIETQCSYKPIGDIGRSRLANHDDVSLKVIRDQGQGHRAPNAKMADLKVYLLRHL